MTKEIIVNAGELESRVAIMENGRLMELHVEREPKIVGNIYKGRVTKVLKGMDAAFVDIGIERNAFLAASDVVPEIDDENGGSGHGRLSRAGLPPIDQLLRANQEILAQVVRAPLGTKGARITTRLSIPGRYMVLMLNSGSYVGVSRKIEESKERTRLRTLAGELRPENYSLIVRTEAEGKSEEELRQDITFLTGLAQRIESKANSTSAPALIHGDLTLIFRLIRDAFTRDVNRLVVDSPATYENVLELVGMIAPRMKNRVFLYDEAMPIFHAYNIEPEIERTLRRKVWLPSGGSLVIDQAEALTAIDVNTGRFVGSVELAETVLTTNLQAAEEVARQLRLRDLGGIIVVDFIDMDNAKHRQQVTTAFEDALRRDRAKLKVHSISPLGLVEMTRKRTGESLSRLLTEPCPYCSGIGRVQNALTMALRIEREIAATTVEHPEMEACMLTAHPRVVASMLGYEGEAHRDLEAYLERPVYLRIEDNFHPNAYRLERLTLEQALVAVKTVEEGDIVEGQVVNPDPDVSLSPLVQTQGIFLIVPDLDAPVGARVKVRITDVGTSLAVAEPLAEEQRGIHAEVAPRALARPPLVPDAILPAYLREERAAVPPHGLHLLSPTAEAVPVPISIEALEEEMTPAAQVESTSPRRRKRSRRRKSSEAAPAENGEEIAAAATEPADEGAGIEVLAAMDEALTEAAADEDAAESVTGGSSRRRRRRRRGRGGARSEVEQPLLPSGDEVPDLLPVSEVLLDEFAQQEPSPTMTDGQAADVPATRRRRGARRRRADLPVAPLDAAPYPLPESEPVLEEISPEAAAEAMLGILNAIAPAGEDAVTGEGMPEDAEASSRRSPRRRSRRGKAAEAAEMPAQELPTNAMTPEDTPPPAPAMPTGESEPATQRDEPTGDSAPATKAASSEAAPESDRPKRRRRAAAADTAGAEGATPRRRTRRTSAAPEETPEPPLSE